MLATLLQQGVAYPQFTAKQIQQFIAGSEFAAGPLLVIA